MTKSALFFLSVFLPLQARAVVVAFEDLPGLVKGKNENVQAAQSSLKGQEARTGNFARSFLPSVSAGIGSEKFKGGNDSFVSRGSWAVEARVNLFRGGIDYLESEIRGEAVTGAKAEYHQEYAKELQEARVAYWKLVGVNQLLKQQAEAQKKNEDQLKSAQRRSGAGVATATDALQFELHATILKQGIKRLELERDLLRNQLGVALAMEEHEELQVVTEFPHPPDSAILPADLVIEKNANLSKMKSRETLERLRKSQASRWWMPTLDVYAGVGVPALSNDYSRAFRREKEWVGGVRLGIDFGNGLESFQESRAKAYEAESQQKKASHALRETVAADHELRHDLKLIHELMHDADGDVTKAAKFLQLTQNEYTRGAKNGPDMLSAFQRYYEFLERRTNLYREFHEKTAELQALLTQESD